jgi:CheY-like chemotaxis protein
MAEDATPQILVIDDNPTVCSTVAFLLKSAGYEVSTAENGFDALLQLSAPDLNPWPACCCLSCCSAQKLDRAVP